MKDQVERHSADITKIFEDVAAVQNEVTAVQEDVITVQGDVSSVATDVVSLTSSHQQLLPLGTRGIWCGYQDLWNKFNIITYDNLIYSDSNMNITDTPLDISTGIYI